MIDGQLKEVLRNPTVIVKAEGLQVEYKKARVGRRGAVFSSPEDERKLVDKKRTEIETYIKNVGQYDEGTITRFPAKNPTASNFPLSINTLCTSDLSSTN